MSDKFVEIIKTALSVLYTLVGTFFIIKQFPFLFLGLLFLYIGGAIGKEV